MASRASEKTPILPTTQGDTPRATLASRLRQPRTLLAIAGVTLLAATVLILSLRTSPPAFAKGAPIVSTVFPAKEDGTRDMLQFCEEKFITQELDHFRANGGGGTFEQRYFVCSQETFNPKNGTIFFYFGAEADVLLYLNSTGLMWENAKAFNALIVFAEHRYFGKSIPFGAEKVLDHMEFLASTQALADYAVLVQDIKETLDIDVPVIGFGGSYGGMLGTWFRTKYPHIVDGVIAGSAPVLAFVGDKDYPVDDEGFLRVVTFDMSAEAGSAPNCIPNVRKATQTLTNLGKTEAGRKQLASLFNLCEPEGLTTEVDVENLVGTALGAYGNLAMGNYPYPSPYITSGASFLPAYPVRAACEHLRPDFAESDTAGLITAFRDSVGVFYNSTQTEKCYFPASEASAANDTDSDIKGNFWGYLECSELYMPSASDGIHDVFPAAPANATEHDQYCFEQWGVHLRPKYGNMEYGGLKALRAASNIVFSNGNYDPWSATGVLETLSDSVVYLPIEGGAHHLDLFFTHPMDPPAVTQARQTELQHIRKWVEEFYAKKQ
ncbi:hypothetical protein Gpo141_00007180 [Globisporangium polare]